MYLSCLGPVSVSYFSESPQDIPLLMAAVVGGRVGKGQPNCLLPELPQGQWKCLMACWSQHHLLADITSNIFIHTSGKY